ncbi:unnamed protein product [Strongylus vulgaris]|uniref:Uncharacterized protein n=1 Tax=Strongylus vulgaris TaxID=40348 RepID=A0A3P7IQM9_STRVU|nr:unnamed protein product [Strongylus vulgaris]
MKTDMRQLTDGEEISSWNAGGAGSICIRSYQLFWLLRLYPLHKKTITIINHYSLTSAADDLELDAFKENLEKVIHKENYFYKYGVTLM